MTETEWPCRSWLEEAEMEGFVDSATMLVQALGAATSRRGFLGALADFERMLKGVPDDPRSFSSDADYDALHALADRAIEHIERRLEARADRPPVQQQLAATIYRLRAEMESIYSGLHHEAGGRPSRNGRSTAIVSPSR